MKISQQKKLQYDEEKEELTKTLNNYLNPNYKLMA